MIIQTNKITTNFILVFLLIACTGVPFFVSSYYFMPVFFVHALFIARSRHIFIFDQYILLILFSILLLVLFRELTSGFFPSLYSLTVIVLKYLYPYVILKILKEQFVPYFKKAMYYIALTSLFFFIFFLVFPSLENIFRNNIGVLLRTASKDEFYTYAPNIIIYTFSEPGRNAGPFWEPGGFIVFLVLALIFHIFQKKNLFNKEGIVLLIASLTTFSTAGYVALFFILISYIVSLKDKSVALYLISLPALILVAYFVFKDSEFMNKKIEAHYSTIYGDYDNRVANRFTSFLIDRKKIENYPLFGYPEGFRDDKSTIYTHRNNGLSTMAVKYGIIYFSLFFFLTILSFLKLMRYYGSSNTIVLFFCFLSILSVYFGQVLTDKPLLNSLFMLFFIQFNYKNNKELKVSYMKKKGRLNNSVLESNTILADN